jgi:hypothetical protein
LERSYGRGETCEADDTVEDHVGRLPGEMLCGTGAGENLAAEAARGRSSAGFQGDALRLELCCLAAEEIHVCGRGKGYDVEAVRVGAHDVEGLAADAARRAQDGETPPHGRDVCGDLIQVRRCSIPRVR